jgi:hypothetical protein
MGVAAGASESEWVRGATSEVRQYGTLASESKISSGEDTLDSVVRLKRSCRRRSSGKDLAHSDDPAWMIVLFAFSGKWLYPGWLVVAILCRV